MGPADAGESAKRLVRLLGPTAGELTAPFASSQRGEDLDEQQLRHVDRGLRAESPIDRVSDLAAQEQADSGAGVQDDVPARAHYA